MSVVRTRFAPSPTGFLHIGGVRTALFNWLFSQRHGGKFILRIDDTDQERNVEAALAPILHGFHWLGLQWDEGPQVGGPHAPYFQSQRAAHYQQAVDALLARGAAYYDYATADEMDAERQLAQQQGQQFQYSRRWMATTEEQRSSFAASGRRAVVRLRMPRTGTLIVQDLVRGAVEFVWAQEQDHVIQRADGSFIYHLANVVDDHAFGITHVIRAEEHLSNTPRQIFMVQALGYPQPQYAHLPYVAEPGSKRKLSKRKVAAYLKSPDFAQVHHHGLAIAQVMGLNTTPETFNPVTVDFYEQVGYLPEAIINYLLLLGWSLDDKTEFLSRAEMLEHFSLERVGKGASSFDPAKLEAFQMHYMQRLSLPDKVAGVLPYLERAGWVAPPLDAVTLEKVERVVRLLGDRIKVFGDILLQGSYFFGRDVVYDEKAFTKRLRTASGAALLHEYRVHLNGQAAFDATTLEQSTQAFLAARNLKLGDIVHAVRVAVTGVAGGPGLFDCLALIGKDTCLYRIDCALKKLG